MGLLSRGTLAPNRHRRLLGSEGGGVRLEKVEGASKIFWEFKLLGKSLTVSHGTVGADSQVKTNTFDTPMAARVVHDQLVAFKVSQGFAESTGPDIGTALEQMIAADEDEAAWRVHGDWLLSQGDPRGELLSASAQGKPTANLIRKNAQQLLGPFAPGEPLHGEAKFSWSMGYWREATVLCSAVSGVQPAVDQIATVLRELLAHPSARFLRSLTLGISCKPRSRRQECWSADWQRVIALLVSGGRRPSLRELVIGQSPGAEEDRGEMSLLWRIGHLDALWSLFPGLRSLTVQGRLISLGRVHAPALQSLTLWSSHLGEDVVLSIAHAGLPALTHLRLAFGDERLEARVLAPILDGESLPALRTLSITNSNFGNESLDVILTSPLLPRLSSLDLSYGWMSDAILDSLVGSVDRLEHLESIDLRKNFLRTQTVQRLQGLLRNVLVAGQRLSRPVRWVEPQERRRMEYVNVEE